MSSGNKATDDPILAVNSRADAQDILAVRDDLTREQSRHLEKVILREHRVVRVGKQKQPVDDYWEKRVKGFTVFQLRRHFTKVKNKTRRIMQTIAKLSPASRFKRPLERELAILGVQLLAAEAEYLRRTTKPKPTEA